MALTDEQKRTNTKDGKVLVESDEIQGHVGFHVYPL